MPIRRALALTAILALLLVAGCGQIAPSPLPPTSLPEPTGSAATPIPSPLPTSAGPSDGLSEAEAATLASLEKVDDFPLYTMHYQGGYGRARAASPNTLNPAGPPPQWACSLFAALGDEDSRLYGRNFDWEFSPAVLLFTDPPNGYASVSMVDIAYLGFRGDQAHQVTNLPLDERRSLLDAPHLPFDGMNEQGLAVGMAAVPPGGMRPDPSKETRDSLAVIREALDHAANVDEAVAILGSYNIEWGGGPPLHYLVADRSGRSALVEFYQGEIVIMPNETTWQQATNFLRSAAGESAEGECRRYDRIDQQLAKTKGQATLEEAMSLLADVAQNSTQWSVVYNISNGDVNVSMGRQYENAHTFHLSLTDKAD